MWKCSAKSDANALSTINRDLSRRVLSPLHRYNDTTTTYQHTTIMPPSNGNNDNKSLGGSTHRPKTLPPGLTYILRHTPTIATPPFLVYILLKLAHRYHYFDLTILNQNRWLARLAYVFAFPIWLFVKIQWRDLRDKREARRAGGMLPPRVRDWTPGGLKSLRKGLVNIRSGYPGNVFLVGFFYHLRIMH